MKRPIRLIPFLLLLLAMSGCSALALLGAARGSNPAATYGVERDNAIFLSGGQPRSLDPARTHGGPGSISGHIFSGLVTLAPDLTVQPDLAVGWQADAAGTTYTFYLHPFAQFHDGRPVTADDVRFSWERALRPETASDTALTYLGDIVGATALADGAAQSLTGVTVIDERTLQVTIDAPKPTFLAKLTFPAAFVVDQAQVDEREWERRPNGTGPFTLQAWQDDEILVLARNAAFYAQPAHVAHVVYLLGAGLPLAQYELGEIDLVGVGGSTLERMRDPNEPLSAELRTTISLCTTFIGLDTTRPPFDDARVRQAFNYALDQEKLIDGLYRGSGLAAAGILPPGMPGFSAPAGYAYDPDRARALVQEAGYDQLPPLTFATSGYTDVGALETAVITQWQSVFDVTIEPELIDPFIYFEEIYAGNIGSFFDFGWCADYPDPENFFDTMFLTGAPTNLGGFSDRVLDDLLLEARLERDLSTRLQLYAQAEARLIEQAPVIFIAHSIQAELVSPRLQGYVTTPLSVAQWHRVRLNP